MSERDLFPDGPPTPEESEEARRFAESLDSGEEGGADPRALSVAHLLRGLSADGASPEEKEAGALAEALESGDPGRADRRSLSVAFLLESLAAGPAEDRLAAARLRRELVGTASRRTLRRVVLRWAAAAALLVAVLGGTRLWRSGRHPDEDLLARREAAALEAVASISDAGVWDPGAERRASHLESLRQDRFAEAVQSQRTNALFSQSGASETGASGGGGSAPRDAGVLSGGAS